MTICTEALSEKELAALRLTASHPAEVVGEDGEVWGEMPDLLVRRLLVTLDTCDAEKAVLVAALKMWMRTRRACGPCDPPHEHDIECPVPRTEAALANTSPAAAAELCHLKGCGREAVIGAMKVWGPEYRVAMCEHHVMKKLRAAAALLARGERVREALKNMKCPGCATLVGEPNNRLRCPDCFDARAALAPGEET